MLPRYSFICLLLVSGVLAGCNKKKTYTVKMETVDVSSFDDILPLTDTLVKPIVYNRLPSFGNLPVKKIKSKFIAATLPSILIAKHQYATNQQRVRWLKEKKWWTPEDSTFYLGLKDRFRATDTDDLIVRLETLPASVILAQAAIESAGAVALFRTGNNLFGMWAFNKNEPRIAARIKRSDKTIYLRKYDDITASVLDYLQSLARTKVYADLRNTLQQTRDPYALIPHLQYFSEQRTAYTKKIRKLMEQNDLPQFDKYQLDPAFLVEVEEE
ncbi:MAG: hypothetical protein HC859_06230 [Bacteroidia bacterium]|nr:hypothetical protein [Bacteroidia bacterium]